MTSRAKRFTLLFFSLSYFQIGQNDALRRLKKANDELIGRAERGKTLTGTKMATLTRSASWTSVDPYKEFELYLEKANGSPRPIANSSTFQLIANSFYPALVNFYGGLTVFDALLLTFQWLYQPQWVSVTITCFP